MRQTDQIGPRKQIAAMIRFDGCIIQLSCAELKYALFEKEPMIGATATETQVNCAVEVGQLLVAIS